MNLEKEVYISLYQLRKLLLNNKGLIFYEDEKQRYFGKETDSCFGFLFLVEGEFILKFFSYEDSIKFE